MISSKTLHRAEEPGAVLDLARFAEVGTFMSHVFNTAAEKRAPADQRDEDRPGADPAAAPDLDEVDVLLGKASKAIEFLAARCAILELELADRDELAAEHEQATRQWEQFAVRLQAQTCSDQDTIADLVARSDTAEARIVALEATAAEAGQRSAAARAESTRLQSQVVAAFGRKSPVHSVLQSIPLQDAAE